MIIYYLDAGQSALKLKKLIIELGIEEQFIMDDLVETLKHQEEFVNDIASLNNEIEYSTQYRRKFSNLINHTSKQEVPSLLTSCAMLVTQVAKDLYTNLVAQGKYNKDGEFLYKFHTFDGRFIYLLRRDVL